MRFAVAALCVLALTGSAEARDLQVAERNPCDMKLPANIVQPDVKFDVFNVTEKEMRKFCPHDLQDKVQILGCTHLNPDGTWDVLILQAVPLDQIGCAVRYEMAHMPPNYWGDPAVETAATIQWLKEQRAAYLKGRTSP